MEQQLRSQLTQTFPVRMNEAAITSPTNDDSLGWFWEVGVD